MGESVEEERDHLLGDASSDHDHNHDLAHDAQEEPGLGLNAFANEHNLQPALPVLLLAASTLHEPQQRNSTSQGKWSQPLLLYLCIAATALGGIGQGWAQTGINGANLYYPKLWHIDALRVGWINCAIYLSNGLLGSAVVVGVNSWGGRRGAVFVGALVSLACNVAGSLARSWQGLLLCRLALGLGLALLTSSLNVFVAECAPAAIRGGLAVTWQMFVAFGIFAGFATNMLIDGAAEAHGPARWKMMLMAAALPTVPLLVIILFCPESPAWYVKRSGRYDRAYTSLCRLRNTKLEAARDLLILHAQQKQLAKAAPSSSSYVKMMGELFTTPRIRRATVAAYSTMLAQQLCGINIVAFYSNTIFVEAHFSPYVASLASTIFGLVNFLGAFPAIWTMDSLGRRSLLLFTLPLMSIFMAMTSASFAITNDKIRLGVAAGTIYVFCLLYSPGMGPVPTTYSAEVFPLSHREHGTSSAVAVANLSAALLSLTFPRLLDTLGTQGSFLLYAVLNVVAWALVYLFVPETKRKTLEELDGVFSVPTRRFVRYQVYEYAPWWTRRYVFARKGELLSPEMDFGQSRVAIEG